jgi:hypothetical protein
MNRLTLLILFAVIAIGGYFLFRSKQSVSHSSVAVTSQEHNEWRSYVPPSGKFTVALPVVPQHATDTVNDITTQQLRRYEMYVAESADDTVYMVNMITYPNNADLKNRQRVFKQFVDDMLASTPKNKLLSSTPTQFQGRDALDFIIQNDEGLLESKLFLEGDTLYVLSRLAKLNATDNGGFQKFVSSFELSNTPATK